MATQSAPLGHTATVPRQRWVRILPVAFLMYTIAYMDRINVGFAFSGMEKDLGFGAAVAGLAGGIFFVGYMILQIPGGHLAAVWSAKKFVFAALIGWGIFAVLNGLVQNTPELLADRFLLGVAEGGVWPATLILLAKWFPLEERARANSYWMFCLPIAAIIVSPLSGWILTWSSWRTLFIIEGIPAFVWAAIWWFNIEESPDTAKWITPPEREYLHQKFAQDRGVVQVESGGSWAAGLSSPKVWLLVLVYFLIQVGFYGFSLWLPTIVKLLTSGNEALVGGLTAIPYVAAVFGLYINAVHSDRTGERKWHVAIPLIGGGIALLISGLIGKSSPVAGFIFLILTEGFLLPYVGVFWTLPPMILDAVALGPAMGLINALGNLGGFVGPYAVGALIARTGADTDGIWVLVVALILAGLIILTFRYKQIRMSSPAAAAATGH
jgi:MFS family permease